MRWTSFCLSCAFVMCLHPLKLAAAEKQFFDIGLIEFVPLITFTNQEPGGPIYEYAQDILQATDLPLTFHLLSINRSLEQLRSHSIDLVLTLFKTTEREAYVRFSAQPLLTLNSGFCTNADFQKKPLDRTSRLAHVRGTVLPPALQKMERIPVTGDNAQIRMLQMLIKGRVQAVYSPKPEIFIMAAHQAKIKVSLTCYEISKSRMPIYFGYSRNLPQQYLERLENAFQKKVSTEDFDAFLNRRLVEAGIKPPVIHELDLSYLLPIP